MKKTRLNYSNTVVFASLKEVLSYDFECLNIEEQLTACTVLFNQGWGRDCFTIPAGCLLVVLVVKYALEELSEVFCFRWVAVQSKGLGIAGACRVVLLHSQCIVVSNAIQCAPSWNFHIVLCCCKLVRLSWPSGGQARPVMFESARFSWQCTNFSKRVLGTYEWKVLKEEELESWCAVFWGLHEVGMVCLHWVFLTFQRKRDVIARTGSRKELVVSLARWPNCILILWA